MESIRPKIIIKYGWYKNARKKKISGPSLST